MSGWFGTSTKDLYRVTGLRRGWLGETKVTKTVTGRQAADRLARQMRRNGNRDVRVNRDGWWAL